MKCGVKTRYYLKCFIQHHIFPPHFMLFIRIFYYLWASVGNSLGKNSPYFIRRPIQNEIQLINENYVIKRNSWNSGIRWCTGIIHQCPPPFCFYIVPNTLIKYFLLAYFLRVCLNSSNVILKMHYVWFNKLNGTRYTWYLFTYCKVLVL